MNGPRNKRWYLLIPALTAALVIGLLAAFTSVLGASATQANLVSIYPDRTVPVTQAEDDALAAELGVRFSVSTPGAIVGLRYYKSTRNTGPHTGTLWTGNGTRLATATFTDESRSGWQTVRFQHPVGLIAGTSYVASYHTTTGYYAQQQWAFRDGQQMGNRTIHATSGVYDYGSGGFPNNAWHSAAYYMDVLFQPGSSGATPVPPSQSTSPTHSSAPPTTTRSHTTTPPSKPTMSTSSAPPATSTTPAPPSGGGGKLPANTVPKPGQVGYIGATSDLKVIDSAAAAPKGTTWTDSGLRIDGGSVVLDHVWVKIGIDIYNSPNVTVTNSIVDGASPQWSGIFMHDAGCTLSVADSTIRWVGSPRSNGGGSWGNGAINGDCTESIVRTDISGTPDGVQTGGKSLVFSQNYVHDLAAIGQPPNDTHNDGLQIYGGSETIAYNRIDVGYDGFHQNSAVFLDGDMSGPQVVGNYLAGGGYVLRIESGVRTAVVTGNTFGPLTNNAYGYDYARSPATISSWSGNVDVSGKALPIPKSN
jgi:hypothetical protein